MAPPTTKPPLSKRWNARRPLPIPPDWPITPRSPATGRPSSSDPAERAEFFDRLRSLFEQVPTPTEQQVREMLSGHLCRCTGYTNIVNAVLEVAAQREAQRNGRIEHA